MQPQEQEQQDKENASDDDEIGEVEREIDGLDSHTESHIKKIKERVKYLVELYEKRFLKCGKPINLIRSTISKRFPNSSTIQTYLSTELDDKYKLYSWSKKKDLYESVDYSTLGLGKGYLKKEAEPEYSEEYKSEQQKAFENIVKFKDIDPDALNDPKKVRKLAEFSYDIIQKCESSGVELDRDYRQTTSVYINKRNKKKDSEDDRKSLEALPEDQRKKKTEEIFGAKLFKLGDIIYEIAHDVIDKHYLSDDPKIHEEYTKWIDAWIAFFEPIADKRYTGDWRDWFQPTIDKILSDNPDPDDFGPPRIDTYKIYSNGTVKSKYPFTKKHVAGDGMVHNINNVLKIQSNIIFGRGLFDNYRDTKFKQTKKRKKDTHDTMSNA